jgi:hypothetical protein
MEPHTSALVEQSTNDAVAKQEVTAESHELDEQNPTPKTEVV